MFKCACMTMILSTNVCHGIMSEDFLWVAKKIGDICKEILPPLNLQKVRINKFSGKDKTLFSRDKYHQPFFLLFLKYSENYTRDLPFILVENILSQKCT